MCRGWSEWFFILELCQPKRLKQNFGGTADDVEVGKQQCRSWKEWSQPLLPVPMQIYCQCYCLCLWSHTLNGTWDVIWANNKSLLLLPSFLLWHSLGHRTSVWALDPVCTSETAAGQGRALWSWGSEGISSVLLLGTWMQWHLQPFVLLPIAETQHRAHFKSMEGKGAHW